MKPDGSLHPYVNISLFFTRKGNTNVDRPQRLFLVLKALSSSGRKVLRVPTLMKRAGYKKMEDLIKDLKILESEELIGYTKSGFPSDSHLHQKVVILRADVISLMVEDKDEEEEFPIETHEECIIGFSVLEEGKIEVPSAVTLLTTRFFELTTERHLEEAERMLSKIKELVPKQDWFKGYYYALNGVLLAVQSKDEKAFINNVKPDEDLGKVMREMQKEAKDPLHAEYDRGFFSAMKQYFRLLQIKKSKRTT